MKPTSPDDRIEIINVGESKDWRRVRRHGKLAECGYGRTNVAHPVVTEDVAVVPEFLNDLGRGRHSATSSCELVVENEAVERPELGTQCR
jgi:hypothetical protein